MRRRTLLAASALLPSRHGAARDRSRPPSAELGVLLATEAEGWARLVREAGLRAE